MENIVLVLLVISIFLNIKFLIDINSIKKNKNEIKEVNTNENHDIQSVTNINNKEKLTYALEDQINISKRYDRNLSLIHFSIDQYVELCSEYNKKELDNFFKEITDLVVSETRASDVFGRWSEEEFSIILPETSMIHAIMLAEKLRQKIEVHQFGEVSSITACFAVTMMDEEKESVETFVSRVQSALNNAKESGVNKVEVI